MSNSATPFILNKAAGKKKAVTPSPQAPARQPRCTRGAAVPASPTGLDERDETPLPDNISPKKKKSRAFVKTIIVAKVGKHILIATPVIFNRIKD